MEQPGFFMFQSRRMRRFLGDPRHGLLVKMFTRSVASVVMAAIAHTVFSAGHLVVAAVVTALQILVFKEILAVRYDLAREREIPYFRTVVWLWFFVAVFYAYGITYLRAPFGGAEFLLQTIPVLNMQIGLAAAHEYVSFCLYCITFVLTVLTFKPGQFQYQMQQLAWTFLTIGVVILQCKSIYVNIYEGLFFVIFPGMLIITNDVMAYFVGVSLGRRLYDGPFLPDLSPKKTWEGFVGGGLFTLVVGWHAPVLLAARDGWQEFICGYEQLSRDGGCELPDAFRRQTLTFWPASAFVGEAEVPTFEAAPIQLHGMGLALFASLIAPFGGFFASAIKRACGVKDFGDMLPGHGGFTDRLDCQFIMALCVNVHFSTFLWGHDGGLSALTGAGSGSSSTVGADSALAAILAAVGGLSETEDLHAVIDAAEERLISRLPSDATAGAYTSAAGSAPVPAPAW
jgi:phosphatidate cytidylyltransferase